MLVGIGAGAVWTLVAFSAGLSLVLARLLGLRRRLGRRSRWRLRRFGRRRDTAGVVRARGGRAARPDDGEHEDYPGDGGECGCGSPRNAHLWRGVPRHRLPGL